MNRETPEIKLESLRKACKLFIFIGMMINHSTLDRHVTFSTRSLAGPERLIDTLTL